ncbi:CGNR zinc finger domain-containing protein [Pseudonocardia nigra]|uniref:CGNR zinc finger domain-containing protein n=1 Tax=Pseudonocardia nigra TaxID=1921578 RepID=UPI0027E32E27|nr:CGNR zinc finger domain-containing protein [Pseudonocardia nigra]
MQRTRADAEGDLTAELHARGLPQRPLVGESPAVDLLNTRWIGGGERYDLLEDEGLTAVWLGGWGLPVEAPPSEVQRHLRDARDALAAVIADPAARDGVNALLAHGRIRLSLDDGGPAEHHDVADPARRPAFACLREYLRLAASSPARVRKCGNPDCVLHFHDTSRTGERRWCSMAACGNRFKARRHRSRTASAGGAD